MNKFPFRIGSSVYYTGIGFNPFYKGVQYSLSTNHLTASNAGGRGVVLTVQGFSNATTIKKPYCEIRVNSGSAPSIGIANHSVAINPPPPGSGDGDLGSESNGWAYVDNFGSIFGYHNNSFPTYPTPSVGYGSTDIIGIALDMVNGYVYFSKNGSWLNGASLSGIASGSGTGAAFTGLTGTLYFAVSNYGGNASSYTINTGTGGFTYTVPTGFSGF